jgi:hypothetical protein
MRYPRIVRENAITACGCPRGELRRLQQRPEPLDGRTPTVVSSSAARPTVCLPGSPRLPANSPDYRSPQAKSLPASQAALGTVSQVVQQFVSMPGTGNESAGDDQRLPAVRLRDGGKVTRRSSGSGIWAAPIISLTILSK